MPTILTPRIGPRAYKKLTRPATPLPYQPQPDDYEMLKILARYRFADGAQIARWLNRSVPVVNRRLYRMWSHGLVARPGEQVLLLKTFFHHGDTPKIWALTRAGVKTLLDSGYALARRIDWTFRPVSASNLPHTLETTECMITLHREIAARSDLTLREHTELIDTFPEHIRNSRRPFSIGVQVPYTVKVKQGSTYTTITKTRLLTNVPDRVFEIGFDNDSRINFTLEWDRGQQSHNAKRIDTKSNVRRKQLVYFHAYLQGRFTEQFGWQRQRCLFVTDSETRLNNMIRNQIALTGGRTDQFPNGQAAAMFAYSTPERLAKHGILGPAWKTADADGVSILPTPTQERS